MTFSLSFPLMILLMTLSACSNKAAYNNIQTDRQLQCQKEPLAQYDECMAQYQKPYPVYEREREELLNEEP